MATHDRSVYPSPCQQLLEYLKRCSESDFRDYLSRHELTGYKALLAMLGAMVDEARVFSSVNHPTALPGYFALVCFDRNDITKEKLWNDRHGMLTAGAKRFFESQAEGRWLEEAVEAGMRGDISLGQRLDNHTIRSVLLMRVSMLQRKGLITTGQADLVVESESGKHLESVSLWSMVYHAMRAGALGVALHELSLHQLRGADLAAFNLLRFIRSLEEARAHSRVATHSFHASKAGSVLSREEFVRAVQEVKASLQREESREDHRVDPYRAFVFNLVGLVEKKELATAPIADYLLEDFLWGHLWFIHVSHQIDDYFVSEDGDYFNYAVSFPSLSNKLDWHCHREEELLELIFEYGGASYFDADGSSPSAYATILIACHRFGDAILYLWQNNQTFVAVQLVSICLYYGLLLPHVPLSQCPAHPLVSDDITASQTNKITAAAIIKMFISSNFVPESNVEIRCDYLMTLDSNWFVHAFGVEEGVRETHKLKAQEMINGAVMEFLTDITRPQLTILAGEPLPPLDAKKAFSAGRAISRSRGRLDEYYNQERIDALLCRAAFELQQAEDSAIAGLHFFLLAGRYAEAIELLCREFCKYLIPPYNDADDSLQVNSRKPSSSLQGSALGPGRDRWNRMAQSLQQKYLGDEENLTQMKLKLQSSGRGEDLLQLLRLLTCLYDFVEKLLIEEDVAQALRLLEDFPLIATSEAQMVTAVALAQTMLTLSKALSYIFDDVLVLAAECIRGVYHQTKKAGGDGQRLSVGLVTDRDLLLSKCKEEMQVLIRFVQQLQGQYVSPDTLYAIRQHKASML